MIVVDRIINGVAVCEADGAVIKIPLSEIGGGVREGDVLRRDEAAARYVIDAGETEKRRESIERRFERIKARGAGGVSPLTIPACGRRTRATEPTQGE